MVKDERGVGCEINEEDKPEMIIGILGMPQRKVLLLDY